MEKKLVSIIVPVYNVKLFLARCIDSLINQTYKNIEIILVDDGSTDGSEKICDSYQKKDLRIKVIHKKNGGLSSARNAGIKVMRGEYVFFLDSDDYISNNAIEIMLNTMIVNDLDIVSSNWILFWDDGRKKVKYEKTRDVLVFNSKEAIIEMNKYRYIDMSATKLFKKELFDSISFPEGKLSEDFFVMYKIFDKAKKIGYISTPLFFYYQRTGSISKSQKVNFDFVEAAENQLLYVKEKYPDLVCFMKGVYMVSNLTAYNAVIVNGGKISNNDYNTIKNNIKKYYNRENIIKLRFFRKIEIRLFILNSAMYNNIIKIYKKF